MLFCILQIMQSTSVRIDRATHQELSRLAEQLDATLGDTIALAIRKLRQERMGEELSTPLTPNEQLWLDADPR